MNLPTLAVLPLILAGSVALHAQQSVPSGEFKKQQLTDEFWAEGANFGDFNKDGKMDVVYGQWWWEGPAFTKRHEYQHIEKSFAIKQADGTEKTYQGFKGQYSPDNEYSKNFFAYTYDFNGDGWTDILVLGFPGAESWWFENPQGKDGPWTQHVALAVTENESPTFVDLNGDGRPEIVCGSKGYLGYAEFDPKKAGEPFQWHSISPLVTVPGKDGKPANFYQRFTHGLGVGDVNGDGRADILEKTGWWEQPASLAGDPVWKKHEAIFGTQGGAQMFVYDVNGDGKNDVITSLAAHQYGIAWFEQTNDGGAEGWKKHLIVGEKPEENPQGIAFSQPHAMALIDMNGDGLMDLVTGKRFFAHGNHGDPDSMGTPYLYWFELKREGKDAKFIGHLIDDASGVGTQVVAGDVDGDKKPDVVVGNKRGAFVFLRK
jgi:hypothetical protein